MDFMLGVGIALVVLAGMSVAGYFILRRLFDRASDRVADHMGHILGDLAGHAANTRIGQRTSNAARSAVGGYTNLGAYAAAQGISENEARQEFVQSIERTARIMDAAVRIPGIGPVGLDSVLGLVPVAGDVISAAVAVSLVARSLKYGVPHDVIARMLGNVLFDLLLGAVPVAGDVADIWFRANTRNIAVLRKFLDEDSRNTIDVTPVRVS
jgi:uncharacterized protein DUF4112